MPPKKTDSEAAKKPQAYGITVESGEVRLVGEVRPDAFEVTGADVDAAAHHIWAGGISRDRADAFEARLADRGAIPVPAGKDVRFRGLPSRTDGERASEFGRVWAMPKEVHERHVESRRRAALRNLAGIGLATERGDRMSAQGRQTVRVRAKNAQGQVIVDETGRVYEPGEYEARQRRPSGRRRIFDMGGGK